MTVKNYSMSPTFKNNKAKNKISSPLLLFNCVCSVSLGSLCFLKEQNRSASPWSILSWGSLVLCAHSPNRSLCARGYPELELGAEPMPAAPGAPGGLKLSNGGNWKGSETGTRPPNIPKPRGRAEGLPRREVPAVDT